MRDTLIIGLLLAMPVALILASAGLALLVGGLHRRPQRAYPNGPQPADVTKDLPLVFGSASKAATLP